MRKQIAAANWKMNLTLQQGEALIEWIISTIPFSRSKRKPGSGFWCSISLPYQRV